MKPLIQNPCHENWNRMQPDPEGRFCKACSKTVVDFTGMSDQQLLDYFSIKAQGAERVCGRFRHEQVQAPSFWNQASQALRQFAHALVWVFVLGGVAACGPTETMGDVVIMDTTESAEPLLGDTLIVDTTVHVIPAHSPKPVPAIAPVMPEVMGEVLDLQDDRDSYIMGGAMPYLEFDLDPVPAVQKDSSISLVEDCGPRSLKRRHQLLIDSLRPVPDLALPLDKPFRLKPRQ